MRPDVRLPYGSVGSSLVDVEVSSVSHSFYTGRSRTLVVADRVPERKRRHGKGRPS